MTSSKIRGETEQDSKAH